MSDETVTDPVVDTRPDNEQPIEAEVPAVGDPEPVGPHDMVPEHDDGDTTAPPDSPVRPAEGVLDYSDFPRLDPDKAPTESNPLPVIIRLLEEGVGNIEIAGKEPFPEYLKYGIKVYRLEQKTSTEPDSPMVVYRFTENDIPGEVTPEDAPPARPEVETFDITHQGPVEPTPAEGVFSNPRNISRMNDPHLVIPPLADDPLQAAVEAERQANATTDSHEVTVSEDQAPA